MAPRRFGRRNFMQAALSQVAVLAVLPNLACGGDPRDPDDDDKKVPPDGNEDTPPDRDEVLGTYFEDDLILEARKIGQYYLDTEATGAGAADVDELLAGTLALIEESKNDAAALDALRDAVFKDFGESNLVTLSGWTFSLTEAQLCALAYVYAA